MKRFFLLTLMLSLGACTTDLDTDLDDADADDESVADAEQPIINGQVDNTHFAVGLVQLPNNNFCTGTVIGPRWVLTAAHCMSGVAPSQVTFVRHGNFVVGPIQQWSYAADLVVVHSSYASGSVSNDVALIRLTSDVTNTAPIPITATAPGWGNALTVVGYGVTAANALPDAVRRSATNAIDVLYTTAFDFNGSSGSEGTTCFGDSGGPSLRFVNGVEVVAGTHSQSNCGTIGRDTRIDKHAGWIVQQAQLAVTTVGWRNPKTAFDTNADGIVAALDVLHVINYINAGGAAVPPAQRPAGSFFLDANGDGLINNADVQAITASLP